MVNVTPLELALIPAGAALAGVALGLLGNLLLDWRKDHKEERRQRDSAIAELLTATVDLITGVQSLRAAYQGQSSWQSSARKGAALISAAGSILPGGPGAPMPRTRNEWSALLDWRALGPFLDRMLAELRQLDANQRTIALDLAAVVLPRTVRFYAAVSILTLGPDKPIADAVRRLAEAVGGLMDVIAAKQRTYDQASGRVGRALGEFRAVADRRHR